MRILFVFFFWYLYVPLLRLLSLLLFWNGKLENRERFEKKNKFEALAISFREKGLTADLCFEFSSEGEYQQVAPLIDDALALGKKIELVFFSPSVEKTVMGLAQKHPTQIRYLRFPLVRFLPFIPRRSFTHWVTSQTLIMVRYDLFPELLLWSMHPRHELKFVWFTFKKERERGKGISFWKKLFLKQAKAIIYASEQDAELGRASGLPGEVYDFRIEQIRRRVEKREETFKEVFALYPELRALYHQYPEEKRLIVGNAWPSDLFLLEKLPADTLLVVVPHQLSDAILNAFRERLKNLRGECFEITAATTALPHAHTILVNKKGILCELYADFGRSYVGGGFNGSIHSVLEPLVAGESLISVGPEHHRSTEYDVALSLNRMTEVKTPEQFVEWLNSPKSGQSRDKMSRIFKEYHEARKRVISC